MSDLVVAPRPHQFIPSSSYCKVYSGKTKQKLHGRTPPTHPPSFPSSCLILPPKSSKRKKKQQTTENTFFPRLVARIYFPFIVFLFFYFRLLPVGLCVRVRVYRLTGGGRVQLLVGQHEANRKMRGQQLKE